MKEFMRVSLGWPLPRSTKVFLAVVFGLSGLVLLLRLYAGWELDRKLEQTQYVGDQIINGVQAYQQDHGSYPDSLYLLVPHYLPSIENPPWGTGQWKYRIYRRQLKQIFGPALVRERGQDPDSVVALFELSVPANEEGYPNFYYNSTTGEWIYDN